MHTHTRVCARTLKLLPVYACACIPWVCVYEMKSFFFFSFKFVWNESHIIWELPHTPILPLYKAIKGTFSKRGKYTQDLLENSESQREFFIKHPQVMFCLLGSYFGLGLWVLKLTNLLVSCWLDWLKGSQIKL